MKPINVIPINFDKPVRTDAARNRRLLLDTASRLFAEQGVEAVTMSIIAKEAGVGKGTLYRNFTDKADLCHAMLDEDMREFQQDTLTYLRTCTDPLICIHWFVEKTARYVIAHNDLLLEAAKLSNLEMLAHPAHIWWRQTLIGLMSRLNLQGDIHYFADVLYAMMDVQMLRFQERGLGYDIERIIDGLKSTVERLVRL